jgi:CheY-like chemotaxis protein
VLASPLHWDLVLMDMQMPVLDGVSATQKIRRALPGHLPVIVAMTANAMPQHVRACMDAGMQDFVSKPIAPEILWNTLIRWITPRQATHAAPTVTIRVAVPETAPPWLHSLAAVDGLDAMQGIRRVLGKELSYLKMLRQFINGQCNTLARTREALVENDWLTAERMAHTLKAVAGNIGATLIQGQAQELEDALNQHQAMAAIELLIDRASSSLDTLIAQLVQHLPQATTPLATSSEEESQVGEVVEKLKDLVQQDDATALDLFADNAALMRIAYPDCYPQLDAALAGYDFSEALEYLQKSQV